MPGIELGLINATAPPLSCIFSCFEVNNALSLDMVIVFSLGLSPWSTFELFISSDDNVCVVRTSILRQRCLLQFVAPCLFLRGFL